MPVGDECYAFLNLSNGPARRGGALSFALSTEATSTCGLTICDVSANVKPDGVKTTPSDFSRATLRLILGPSRSVDPEKPPIVASVETTRWHGTNCRCEVGCSACERSGVRGCLVTRCALLGGEVWEATYRRERVILERLANRLVAAASQHLGDLLVRRDAAWTSER